MKVKVVIRKLKVKVESPTLRFESARETDNKRKVF